MTCSKVDLNELIKGKRVLFISPTPGLSPILNAQGIPHMRELHKDYGITFSLLTFEDETSTSAYSEQFSEQKTKLKSRGIDWYMLYNGACPFMPNSTSNVMRGIIPTIRLIKRKNVDLVHCRSYVSAFIMLIVSCLIRIKFIFDVRGLYPDEMVESGVWSKNSLSYRVSRWLEKLCLYKANAAVVVTERQREILIARAGKKVGEKVFLIRNCTNTDRFKVAKPGRNEVRRAIGVENDVVFVWLVGQIRGVHMPKETISFFQECKKEIKSSRLLVLTQSSNVTELLEANGLNDSDYIVCCIAPDSVPDYLSASDVALALVDPDHEDIGIKFAEYLAAGLPVVINYRNFASEQVELVKTKGIGTIIKVFSETGYKQSCREIINMLSSHNSIKLQSSEVAESYYSLKSAVNQYAEVYAYVLKQVL